MQATQNRFDPWLDKLIGAWKLTGQMGAVPLAQDVAAEWVLGGLFVQMTFRDTLSDVNPYEAIYHLGRTPDGRYILHLLDTFGVADRALPGLGTRGGDTVRYEFPYDQGPFVNRFAYDPAADTWEMRLSSLLPEGEKLFAIKRMARPVGPTPP